MILVVEGFGVVFFDELLRRQHHGLVGIVGGHDAELVRPLPPVEDVGVAIGLRPVDQRIGIGAGGARRAARAGASVAGAAVWSHTSRVLQVGCPVNVICSRR